MTEGVETPAEFAVGCSVRLRELSGEIFAVDPTYKVVVLKTLGADADLPDIAILNMDSVTEIVEATPRKTAPSEDSDQLPEVDPKRGIQREARAVRLAQQDAQRIGVGVSRRGQAVYDAISKTLPCHWDSKTIVVLDEVRAFARLS
ncbi:LSM12-like protein [Auxenochlorella protothecoides]|uniref:LSM12-like protein n=1 Tax=Auxenochlorella protothecoides TaxID=3075 RepID=A0A087SH95_AUXPR